MRTSILREQQLSHLSPPEPPHWDDGTDSEHLLVDRDHPRKNGLMRHVSKHVGTDETNQLEYPPVGCAIDLHIVHGRPKTTLPHARACDDSRVVFRVVEHMVVDSLRDPDWLF
jgi:hypothetical protein